MSHDKNQEVEISTTEELNIGDLDQANGGAKLPLPVCELPGYPTPQPYQEI